MAKTESRPQIAFFKKVSRLEEKKSFYESGTKKKFCKPKPSDNFDPVLTISVQFWRKNEKI